MTTSTDYTGFQLDLSTPVTQVGNLATNAGTTVGSLPSVLPGLFYNISFLGQNWLVCNQDTSQAMSIVAGSPAVPINATIVEKPVIDNCIHAGRPIHRP